MSRDSKRSITIEDLIRLKKAERPAADYWARFDAEMRSKQLAAIVGRRTWWHGSAQLFASLIRLRAPIGAFAAIAVAFIGVRFAASRMEPADRASHTESEMPPVTTVAQSDIPTTTLDPVVVEPRSQIRPMAVESKESRSTLVATSAHVVSVPPSESADAPSRTPFSEIVAVTLEHFRESQPDFAKRSVFGSDREFEATLASLRQDPPAEPLSRLDPASEERRSRLLATALPAYATSGPHSDASDHIKERVSNDRMYESMDPYESNTRMSLEIKF